MQYNNEKFVSTYLAASDDLYELDDEGKNFQPTGAINNGLIDYNIVKVAHDNQHIFFAAENKGIFHSTNNGLSWEVYRLIDNISGIKYLLVDTRVLECVFVVSNNGSKLYKVTNNTITEINLPSININVIVLSRLNPNKVYLAGSYSGLAKIYYTDNIHESPVSWQSISVPVLSATTIYDVFITESDELYVVFDNGIYYYNGNSWTLKLSLEHIKKITILNDILYLATDSELCSLNLQNSSLLVITEFGNFYDMTVESSYLYLSVKSIANQNIILQVDTINNNHCIEFANTLYNEVYSSIIASQDIVIACCSSLGIIRISSTDSRISNNNLPINITNIIVTEIEQISNIVEKKEALIASIGKYIFVYVKGDRWYRINPPTNISNNISHIAYDKRSKVLIVSFDNIYNRVYYLKDIILNHSASWFFIDLKESGISSYTDLVLDSKGNAHIVYCNKIDSTYLNYIYFANGDWNIRTIDIDNDIQSCCIAIDSKDCVHIGYATSTAVKYVYYDFTNLKIDTVATLNVNTKFVSIDVDSLNNPHIAFFNSKVVYAKKEASNWVLQNIDINNANIGKFISLKLD